MQLTPGTLLERGKYRIIETLGRGGFGITYLAEQVMAKRRVCIKEFFPKDYYKRDDDTGALTLSSDGFAESMNKFKAKFIKEAQTIATLNHANIIPIHDVFEENNTAYYVMDYIEGESLYDIVKHGGALTEADAVRYIRDTAAALEHIHARQIMHLDVKPGNIMVREEDRRAILIDFGLSKHYDATSGEATSTTPVGVSHGFAPMEQYKQGGVSKFSPETDIYSLGATLYYLVTGKVPPQAADMGKDGIGELPSKLASGICVAIRKSMSYWKEDRPHYIKEFLALLDNKRPVAAVLAAESEKTKITQKPKIQPAVEQPKPKPKTYLERELEYEQKRSRWWVWCLLLLFIVVLCISIKYLNPNGDNSKEIAKEDKTVEKIALDVVDTVMREKPITTILEQEPADDEVVIEPEVAIDQRALFEADVVPVEAFGAKSNNSIEGHGDVDNNFSGRVTVSYKFEEPVRNARGQLYAPAFRAEHSGTVVITVDIDRNGTVKRAFVSTSSGIKALDDVALRAAKHARTIFNIDASAPTMHRGTITYEFIAQ